MLRKVLTMNYDNARQLMAAFLLAASLIAGGCRKDDKQLPAVREYRLRGRVESVDLVKKKVVVAHEDIEGYMKAMTMGFAVPDENALKMLNSGEKIEAKLIFDTRTNLTWLEQIEIVR